jgi:hypothetical protein
MKEETLWAVSWQNQRNAFANSMDPDQPTHPRSLIRIHAVRLQTILQVEKLIAISMYPDQTAESMLVANALCWFCHGAAHFCFMRDYYNIWYYNKFMIFA